MRRDLQSAPETGHVTATRLEAVKSESRPSESPYTLEKILEKLTLSEPAHEEPERWDGMA
jgi:hypothetical protein